MDAFAGIKCCSSLARFKKVFLRRRGTHWCFIISFAAQSQLSVLSHKKLIVMEVCSPLLKSTEPLPLTSTHQLAVTVMKDNEKHLRRLYLSRRLWNKRPHFRKEKPRRQTDAKRS